LHCAPGGQSDPLAHAFGTQRCALLHMKNGSQGAVGVHSGEHVPLWHVPMVQSSVRAHAAQWP